MGLDTERFVGTINEGLLCCICRDVLENPKQAPCEHVYCQDCIEGWLVHENRCPEDRKFLMSSQLRPLFRYMKNDLAKLQIRCKNCEAGCSAIVNMEFIDSHEASCGYTKIQCPSSGCRAMIERRLMEAHLRTCDFRNKDCPNGCGFIIMSTEDAEHSCMSELRTSIELLRSEMICKVDDQKHDTELRLDMQRNHMIQREAALQSLVNEQKVEIAQLAQKVKVLMDLEFQRREDMEKMQAEKHEMIELLKDISRNRGLSQANGRICTGSGKETSI